MSDEEFLTELQCWYCGELINGEGSSFMRNGKRRPVHTTCRPEAITVFVEDQEDGFVPPAFCDEYPIG